MHRLTPDVVSDWEQLKDHLNAEFKITARECRARFETAKLQSDETYIAYTAHLHNLWDYYLRNRKVDDFKGVCDLIIADHLKRQPYRWLSEICFID